MVRWIKFGMLGTITTALSGCAICASPYDCEYPAYGGRVERVDRVHGRVGSVFSAGGSEPAMALTEQGAIDGATSSTVEVPDDLDWSFVGSDSNVSLVAAEEADDASLFFPSGTNSPQLIAPSTGIEVLPSTDQ